MKDWYLLSIKEQDGSIFANSQSEFSFDQNTLRLYVDTAYVLPKKDIYIRVVGTGGATAEFLAA